MYGCKIWIWIAIIVLLSLSLVDSFTTAPMMRRHLHNAARSLSMQQGRVPMVPYYPDPARKEYQWMDIYNVLGRTRTLFVGRFLDDEACNQLIASLVWLNGQSEEKPVTLYFNVPGALGKPSWAVFDIMKKMSCPLITINTGLTVGMGALLCAAGTSGMRYATPNSRFLMSKAGLDDGLQGQAVGLGLAVKEVMKDNDRQIEQFALLTGQPQEKLRNELKRDFYLTAPEAAAYGVVDRVRMPHRPVKTMVYRGDDDDVVTFGHFSEVRKVKAGPNDVVPKIQNEDEFDEYAMKEMMKKQKQGRINPADLKNGGGASRFANSRCRPPGTNTNKPKLPSDGSDGDSFEKDKFKNVF